METRLVKPGEAAAIVGSSPAALRKRQETGERLPARKTKGGTRFYAVTNRIGLGDADAPTVGYACVSSLLRFGAEPVFTHRHHRQGCEPTFEEQLAQDMLEIIALGAALQPQDGDDHRCVEGRRQ